MWYSVNTMLEVVISFICELLLYWLSQLWSGDKDVCNANDLLCSGIVKSPKS